jgi:hypothetical protein
MDTGTIKLGTNKELSRKVPPSILLEGFFYAGSVCILEGFATPSIMPVMRRVNDTASWPKSYASESCVVSRIRRLRDNNPARQCLIFQDNSLSGYDNTKPFQSRHEINRVKKVNCCTGWNRSLSTSRTRTMRQRGHQAGTAIKLNVQAPATTYALAPINLIT